MNYLRNIAIFEHFLNRIRNNKNVLSVITGGTGSGKSYAALREGETLAKLNGTRFNSDNVIFDIPKFLEKKKKAKPGTVFIFDEFGVIMGARDWQKDKNKVMSYILQTFRFENYICIFTVPRLNFIDKHARELMHYWQETQSIDYKRGISKLKVYRLNADPFGNDIYRKFIQIYDKENAEVKACPYLKLKMPSKRLRDAYEKKKADFLNSEKAQEWANTLNGKAPKPDKPKIARRADCSACGNHWPAIKDNLVKCHFCQKRGTVVVTTTTI